jgi:hypothetical protein
MLRGTALRINKGNFVRCDKRCCAQEFHYDENMQALIGKNYILVILEQIQTNICIN